MKPVFDYIIFLNISIWYNHFRLVFQTSEQLKVTNRWLFFTLLHSSKIQTYSRWPSLFKMKSNLFINTYNVPFWVWFYEITICFTEHWFLTLQMTSFHILENGPIHIRAHKSWMAWNILFLSSAKFQPLIWAIRIITGWWCFWSKYQKGDMLNMLLYT